MTTETKPKPKPKTDPLNQIFEDIITAANNWQLRNTKQAVQEYVNDLLNKNRDTIVLKLLGFDQRWGDKWELDHCNGRAGESSAGTFLRNTAGERIKEWLSSAELPPLDKILTKSIIKEYESIVKRRMAEALKEKAEQFVKDNVDRLFAEITDQSQIDAYVKMRDLIDNSNGEPK